jgi:thiol-disulfide isomerase/thioredoxin
VGQADTGDCRPDAQSDPIAALKAEWDHAEKAYYQAWARAATMEEKAAASKAKPDLISFGERFLRLAADHPGSQIELDALCWVALNATSTEPGCKAIEILQRGRIERAAPDKLLRAFESSRTRLKSECRPIAETVLRRANQSLDHPQAARLTAWVCAAYLEDESERAPLAFREAANLIANRFADHPDITHFAESLFLRGVRPWASEFEPHVRIIQKKNKNRLCQATARYALASIARAGGIDRQKEAEELFRHFVQDYGGKARGGVEESLLSEARKELERIDRCGLGKPARAIEGRDLAGNPLKLADYQGKVVLLVFWASWCRPCLADVPHEKELVERFKTRPFVLIGVNGDKNIDEARLAVAKLGIPWRSFWNGEHGASGPIAKDWAVEAWPTVYVIDHRGIIRHDRLRGKRLDEPLETLISKAEESGKTKR